MDANEKVIKEKEVVHDHNGKEYASKSMAGTALGFGIGGAVLGAAALWGRGRGLGIGGGMPENVNINATMPFGGAGAAPTAFGAYEKACEGALDLTNTIWRLKTAGQMADAAHREIDVREKFDLWKSQVDADFANYKATRDLYDNTQDKLNEAAFGLYKGQRDLYDTLDARYSQKFCELDKKVYGMEIANMYQNRIIQMGLNNVLGAAINYADRLDCRNIKGVVTLPNEPTVTGFPSACRCNSNFGSAAAS